jgi:hypothetical protein
MTFIRFFNQLKTTIPVKKCIDCKHYLKSEPMSYANNQCTRVIYRCSDTGVNKFEYAYIARADEKICGPSGSNFELLIRREIK